MVEITGTVTKIGRIKDYGHETNFGRDFASNFKFFMEIRSEEHGIVNAMVECKVEETNYGYRIPKDEPRQKPFVGDVVKISTHQLKKNGATWASVTFNQTIEIIKENPEARKERQEFIEQKKKERDAEFQAKVDEKKRLKNERKQARIAEISAQKKYEWLPEPVRNEISTAFDLARITSILRDTTWFTMPKGEGGKMCDHDPPDGCGYPGTGMRRPYGALYNTPESIRKSILSKAVKSGLITETDDGYKATELGIRLLVKFDVCPVCKELRVPYHSTGHYSFPGRCTMHTDHGVRYVCKHEIQEIYKKQQGCNCGTTYQAYKSTEERLKRIIEISGGNISVPPTDSISPRIIHENGKRIIRVTRKEYNIIMKANGRILTPEEHKAQCSSTKALLPTSTRSGLVCPDCGRYILGGGMGSGTRIGNTRYKIIKEE